MVLSSYSFEEVWWGGVGGIAGRKRPNAEEEAEEEETEKQTKINK